MDVNWDTTKVVTGSADLTAKVWDCETGLQCFFFEIMDVGSIGVSCLLLSRDELAMVL